MFGSEIIDAALGLFLVYFLFSMVCSAVNELIMGHLASWRAKTLETAITRMLADHTVAKAFFAQPLIRGLTKDGESIPTYISAPTFIDGLIALAHSQAVPPPISPPAPAAGVLVPLPDKGVAELEALRAVVSRIPTADTRAVLSSLLHGVPNITEGRKRLEEWFNEGMDRATGWYKKQMHWFILVWSLLVAAAFNVDTFAIARALLNNPKLRVALVASAEQMAKQNPPGNNVTTTPQETLQSVQQQLQGLDLPIGWTAWPPALRAGESWLLKIPGILVTAGALSLGAPFWFELLGRLVNLRAAGKKPERQKEEKPR